MNLTSESDSEYLKVFYPYDGHQEINIIITYTDLPILIAYLYEKLNNHKQGK